MALCRKPWITPSQDIAPCGQCPECLTNRKQLWTNRNILESYSHEKSCFITLTYTDENLPKNHLGIPTLDKAHLQQFFKRLRSKYKAKIRYYAVGEYGTAGQRDINPHYHALLYGIGEDHSQTIQDSWRVSKGKGKTGEIQGFAYTGSITPQSISYVAGYVQKKTKYNKDMYEEFEIIPEFSNISNRPAIGANIIPILTQHLKNNPDYLTPYGDVPFSIHHGDRQLPLGTYIREKVREGLDLPHDIKTYVNEETGELIDKKIWHAKEDAKKAQKLEMQIMQENKAIHDPKLPKDATVSIKHYYQYKNQQSQKTFDIKQKLTQNNETL